MREGVAVIINVVIVDCVVCIPAANSIYLSVPCGEHLLTQQPTHRAYIKKEEHNEVSDKHTKKGDTKVDG